MLNKIEYHRQYRLKNRDRLLAYRRARYLANREKILSDYRDKHPKKQTQTKEERMESNRERARQYYENNKQKCRDYTTLWRIDNPEKFLAQRRAHYAKNKEKLLANKIRNPLVIARQSMARRSRKIELFHRDADKNAINEIVKEAIALTKSTGIQHVIDHIIPLAKGGWHHQDNLQALPKTINLNKGQNQFWEHKDYCSWRQVPRWLWPEELFHVYARLVNPMFL